MNKQENIQLFIELESNLKKQLDFARRGSLESVEELAKNCQSIIEKIKIAGFIESPEYHPHRKQIEKLYHKLMLSLSSHKTAIAEQLKSISRGKKTLEVYRGNI